MNPTRMSATIRSAALAAITLSLAAPLYGQVTLRMMPAEGQVSRYIIGAETSMAGAVTSTTRLYQTETVVNVTADAFEVHTMVDSTAITAAMPGMGGPDLSGTSYAFGMDTRGRVTGLTEAGTLTPELEATISATLGINLFELPEGEVSPGDSWPGQVAAEVPAGMGSTLDLTMEITYTLTSIDGDLAQVSIEGTTAMSGNVGGMAMQGSGTVDGTAVFDTAASRLRHHESVMSLDLTMSGMPSGTMTTNTTRELVP